MKTVELKRSEVAELVDIFEACGGIKPSDTESHDDSRRMLVQTFKWRAGRNLKICRALCERYKEELTKIQDPRNGPTELQEYLDKQDELFKKHATKDDQGTAIIDGQGNVSIPKESRPALKADVDALMAQYPDVVVWSTGRDVQAGAYMDEPIHVEFFSYPWTALPEGIHGDYIDKLIPMLDGAPEE